MPTVVCLSSESCCFLSTVTLLPSAHNTVLPRVTHGRRSPPFRLLWPMAPVGLQDGTAARVSPGLARRPSERPPAPTPRTALPIPRPPHLWGGWRSRSLDLKAVNPAGPPPCPLLCFIKLRVFLKHLRSPFPV